MAKMTGTMFRMLAAVAASMLKAKTQFGRVKIKGSHTPRSNSKYAPQYGAQAAARNLRHLAAGTHGL